MSDPDPLLALEAENRRLRQEADFLSRKLNERSVTYRERCDELDAAEAKVAVLEAALRRYGRHDDGCWLKFESRDLVPNHPYTPRFRQPDDPDPTCDCGFAALLHSEGSPAPEGP